MNDIRQGKCEFADYYGDKHTMTWTVCIDNQGRVSSKNLIKKTDIYSLRIGVDDDVCARFEDGKWQKRPPLWGLGRHVYNSVMALYS